MNPVLVYRSRVEVYPDGVAKEHRGEIHLSKAAASVPIAFRTTTTSPRFGTDQVQACLSRLTTLRSEERAKQRGFVIGARACFLCRGCVCREDSPCCPTKP